MKRKRISSSQCPDCGGRKWGSLGMKGDREFLRCLRCGFDRSRKRTGSTNKKIFDELYDRIYREDAELANKFLSRFIRGTPALRLIYEMTEWMAAQRPATLVEWKEAEIPDDYCDEAEDRAYSTGYAGGWQDKEDGNEYDSVTGSPREWRARRNRKARR